MMAVPFLWGEMKEQRRKCFAPSLNSRVGSQDTMNLCIISINVYCIFHMYLCNIRAPLIHDSGMIKHASQLISGERMWKVCHLPLLVWTTKINNLSSQFVRLSEKSITGWIVQTHGPYLFLFKLIIGFKISILTYPSELRTICVIAFNFWRSSQSCQQTRSKIIWWWTSTLSCQNDRF